MPLIDLISNFSFLGFDQWSYVVIFFVAVLEATPLFGLLVPGMITVIAGGFMAKLGILNIGDVIIVTALGAIIGDLTGYLIGKKYGISFLEKYGKYFFFRKKQFEKIKILMNRHTGKSLIIGRFNSLTRSFAPFIAGSTNVVFSKFLLFNIIGGVTWATTFILVGFIFGQSYEIVARYVGIFMTVTIIAGISIVYLYRFVNKRKHIFSKYHLHILILNLFSLYIFAKMTEDVVNMDLVTRLDTWLSQKISLLWVSPLNEIMILITNIANPMNLFLFSSILFLIFILKKKWYHMTLLVTGMTGGVLLEIFVKLLLQRERPINSLIEISGYSFPSEHATMAIIFFTLLIYAFKDDIKNKILKISFIFSMTSIFLLIGISRVYLNVHWFSDVIAGFALGMFWLTLLVLIFKFFIITKDEWKEIYNK